MDSAMLEKLKMEISEVTKEEFESLTREDLENMDYNFLGKIEWWLKQKAYNSESYKLHQKITKKRSYERHKKYEMEAFMNGVPDNYKEVKLDHVKTLHPKAYDLGMEIIDVDFKKIPSVILYGRAGRGKTYFMWSLAIELTKKYCDSGLIKFVKSKMLDDQLLEASKDFGSPLGIINSLKGVKILMLDDLGMERSTDRVDRDYYDILDARSEWNKPVIISTNFEVKEIKETYGQRIFSRFKEYRWVKFEGDDLRGKK